MLQVDLIGRSTMFLNFLYSKNQIFHIGRLPIFKASTFHVLGPPLQHREVLAKERVRRVDALQPRGCAFGDGVHEKCMDGWFQCVSSWENHETKWRGCSSKPCLTKMEGEQK